MPTKPTEQAQQAVMDEAAAFFDAMDKDDDGKATMMEFVNYLKQLEESNNVPQGKRCTYQGLMEIFNGCDTSNDDKITLDEIRTFISGIPPSKICKEHLKIAFDKMDTSGDGTLSVGELRAMMSQNGYDWTDDEFDSICGTDGVVSFDEFVDAAEELMKQDD